MKKGFTLIVLIAISFYAQAQTKPTISLAANIGAPISPSKIYSLAYGADLQVELPVASITNLTGSVGYQSFAIKKDFGGDNTYQVPLLAGAKFDFTENVYGHMQLGAGFGDGYTSFAYAPSLGYRVSPNVDLSAKYLAFSYSGSVQSSLNLRVAYNF